MKLAAAAVLTLSLLAVPAFAQTDSTPPAVDLQGHGGPGMHHGGPGFGHGMPTYVASITNAPLSARYTVQSQHTAPGPDGLIQKISTTESVYRDSLGRTREDITLPVSPRRARGAAADGTAPPLTQTTTRPHTMTVITDPVANTITRLMPDTKIAVVETVPADFFKHAAAREAREAAGATRHRDNAATTDLGSKTFAGVVASGKRTTMTFPAHDGDTGTAFSTMTHEAWFSPDLKLEVSSTETGGRGTRSDVLTSLTKAEPDATLFKVPEGYTIRNAPAHSGFHRGPHGQDGTAPDAPPPAI